jgi:ribosome-binding protein aMBF1 (putative translation factor)
MDKCDWCGRKSDNRITIVIKGEGEWKICHDCLRDYTTQKFDRLLEKVRINLKSIVR